jgi:hypothetical protein
VGGAEPGDEVRFACAEDDLDVSGYVAARYDLETASSSIRPRPRLLDSYKTYLVVDIGNVHDEIDIVSKVVAQDPADDILSQVVATCQLRMTGVVSIT